jgi:hypothetical protein
VLLPSFFRALKSRTIGCVAGLSIGQDGVGADLEAADADDLRRGGMEAKAARREPLQPTQVLHDRDASRQQRRVHRTRRAAGVVDVDGVDPDQSGLLLDQPVGGGSGQEGFPVA